MGHSASLAIDTPREDLHRISIIGELDGVAGTRLARLVDARLCLIELGQTRTRQILVDLSGAHVATGDGLRHLAAAHRRAAGHHLGVHLVGAGALIADLGPRNRQIVRGIAAYPTVDVAAAALEHAAGGGGRAATPTPDPARG